MAVAIVTELPSAGGGLRRLGRGLAVLVGLILLLAGLLAAVVPLLYLLVFITTIVDEGETPAIDAQLVGVTVGALVAIWLGLRLIRGRRRLGLYLRKFGFQDSTQTVTYALATAVGRSVRLVTLDDSIVAPVGVAKGRRRTAGWVFVLGALVVLAGMVWFVGGGFDSAADSVADDVFDDVSGGSVQEVVGGMLGAAFAVAAILVVLLLVVLIPIAFVLVLALFGGGSFLAARRAERSAARAIASERAIEPTVRSIAKRSRRILGARLVVVRVSTSLWQQVVRRLAAAADIVVIDVSQPTDNLVWEVSTMRADVGRRWVLVGAHEHVTALTAPERLPAGSPQHRLAQLLDGERIIAYGPGPAERRRFARALRTALDAARAG